MKKNLLKMIGTLLCVVLSFSMMGCPEPGPEPELPEGEYVNAVFEVEMDSIVLGKNAETGEVEFTEFNVEDEHVPVLNSYLSQYNKEYEKNTVIDLKTMTKHLNNDPSDVVTVKFYVQDNNGNFTDQLKLTESKTYKLFILTRDYLNGHEI